MDFLLGKKRREREMQKSPISYAVPISGGMYFNAETFINSIRDKLDCVIDPIINQSPLFYVNLSNHVTLQQLKSLMCLDRCKSIIIFSNNISLVLEISISLRPLGSNFTEQNSSVQIRFKEPSFDGGKLINYDDYTSLNEVLKYVLIFLFKNDVLTSGAHYSMRKPYLLIFIKINKDAIIPYHVLDSITKTRHEIKHLSLKFDDFSKAMVLVLKIRL